MVPMPSVSFCCVLTERLRFILCMVYWGQSNCEAESQMMDCTTGWKDKSDNIQDFHCRQTLLKAPTTNLPASIACVARVWYNSLLSAIDLHCCQKLIKTNQWSAPLHFLTCSFITTNMCTPVYFESFPHTASFCRKHLRTKREQIRSWK